MHFSKHACLGSTSVTLKMNPSPLQTRSLPSTISVMQYSALHVSLPVSTTGVRILGTIKAKHPTGLLLKVHLEDFCMSHSHWTYSEIRRLFRPAPIPIRTRVSLDAALNKTTVFALVLFYPTLVWIKRYVASFAPRPTWVPRGRLFWLLPGLACDDV